jgi:murein DD-endopeptidase MepM/ murein hydrolase activator NlpD
MKKYIITSILLPIFLSIFISAFAVSITSNYNISLISNKKNYNDNNNNNNFQWPTPGYYCITSQFGYRLAPTKGASTYHGGIDIGAPYGSGIIAIADGVVTFTGWNGPGGYTVFIAHSNNLMSVYSHVSPNFIVSINDFVNAGDIIAYVGPKYVNDIKNNTYKDASGRATNGATTGPHLHFSIMINGKKIDPTVILD